MGLTLALFWPATRFGFIELDDDTYVSGNPYVQQGLTRQSLGWALTAVHENYWLPVTWVSFMVDRTVQGPRPQGYHRTNVLLHAANVGLLWWLAYGLTGHLGGSVLVAALFGWHPLRLEAVAWISSRKDLLGTFFGLWAMLAYARYVRQRARPDAAPDSNLVLVPRPHPQILAGSESRREDEDEGRGRRRERGTAARGWFWAGWGYYALVCLGMALSLMAKPMWVTLPVLLLLLDLWPLRRLGWPDRQARNGGDPARRSRNPAQSRHSLQLADRLGYCSAVAIPSGTTMPFWPAFRQLCLEKIPLVLIAAGFSAITLLTHASGGAIHSLNAVPLADRLLQIPVQYGAYLWKTLWPVHLAVRYPPAGAASLMWGLASAGLLLATTLLLWLWARRRPWLWVGWLWFLMAFVPVIGLVRIGTADFADRFTYVPGIGLGLLIAVGVLSLPARRRGGAWLRAGASALVLLACGLGTEYQLRFWTNGETLFRRALAITSNNAVAHNSLGRSLENQGRWDEALAQYRASLHIAPRFVQAHVNLGNVLAQQRRYAEAMPHFDAALKITADEAKVHSNYGAVLFEAGQKADGVRHLREAVRLNPRLPDAHFNLGRALLETGDPAGALEHLLAATQINPNDDLAHFLAGRLCHSAGNNTLARRHLEAAVKLRPGNAEYLQALQAVVKTEERK